MLCTVAHAPKNVSRRLPSLAELEDDALMNGSALISDVSNILQYMYSLSLLLLLLALN